MGAEHSGPVLEPAKQQLQHEGPPEFDQEDPGEPKEQAVSFGLEPCLSSCFHRQH